MTICMLLVSCDLNYFFLFIGTQLLTFRCQYFVLQFSKVREELCHKTSGADNTTEQVICHRVGPGLTGISHSTVQCWVSIAEALVDCLEVQHIAVLKNIHNSTTDFFSWCPAFFRICWLVKTYRFFHLTDLKLEHSVV